MVRQGKAVRVPQAPLEVPSRWDVYRRSRHAWSRSLRRSQEWRYGRRRSGQALRGEKGRGMEDRVHRSLTIEPAMNAAGACMACMSRRDFLSRSALAAAALAALEACGDGQIGAPTTLTDGPFTVRIADFPGLNATNVLVDVSSQAPGRAVIRTGPSAYTAFSMICTHQQCLTDVRTNRFECPCHGSRFASDGSVINGPAERPLMRLAVTVNGD